MRRAGRPPLLLHGNGRTHAVFGRAVPVPAEHFTVCAPGSRDMVRRAHTEALAASIPNCRLRILPGRATAAMWSTAPRTRR